MLVQREVVSKERRRPVCSQGEVGEDKGVVRRGSEEGRGPSSLRLHNHMNPFCPLIQPFLQIFHTPYLGDDPMIIRLDIPAQFTASHLNFLHRLPLFFFQIKIHPSNFARPIILSLLP